MSRNVFCGANNPFITGIFSARCRSPHQSYWREGASRPNSWGASIQGAEVLWNLQISSQLSTIRTRAGKVCTRCAHPCVCCVCKGGGVKPTGTVQVTGRHDRDSETPCQRCRSYVAISPQRAAVGKASITPKNNWNEQRKYGELREKWNLHLNFALIHLKVSSRNRLLLWCNCIITPGRAFILCSCWVLSQGSSYKKKKGLE